MPAFFYVLFFPVVLYMYTKQRSSFVHWLETLVVSLIVSSFHLMFLTKFFYRERPFLHLPVQHLSNTAKSVLPHVTSFPSGHTRDTMIFAIVLGYFLPRAKIPLVLFACFIGFARIYAGEHYPSDVLAGLVFGYVVAKLSLYVVRELLYKKVNTPPAK